MADTFSNSGISSLAGGGAIGVSLTAAGLSLILQSGDGAKFPPVGPCMLSVGNPAGVYELMKCTARVGDTLTIVRGQEGTLAAIWPVGTLVQQVTTAGNMANLWLQVKSFAYNVRNFGAVGDGVTNDGPAIRAAVAQAQADIAANPALAGRGVIVYLPGPAVYLSDTVANAEDATFREALHLPSGCTLKGDGIGVTVLKLQAASPVGATLVRNVNIATGGNTRLAIVDMTLDGNAANQALAANQSQTGLQFLRAQTILLERVRVQDVFGNASSGVGEGFFFETTLCTDIAYLQCEAIATGANTASGFSADSSTNILYDQCIARSMSVANGFTHNTCANVRYQACVSQLNAIYGFNSEVSENIAYVGCEAGGRSANAVTYPYAANTPLGNSTGININGSAKVTITDCDASYNSNNGLWLTAATDVVVTGGFYTHNTNYGINVDAASVAVSDLRGCRFAANGLANMLIGGGIGNTDPTPNHILPGPNGTGLVSGATNTNPFPFTVQLAVLFGTVSRVWINGGAMYTADGVPVMLRSGDTYRVDFTAAPQLSWFALL